MAYILDIPETATAAGRAVDQWFVRTNRANGTLVRTNGVWEFITNPHNRRLMAADLFYRGGYCNEITSEVASELVAAGFGSWVRDLETFSSEFSTAFS